MKVSINGVIDPTDPFDVDSATPIASGGEGEIFQIPTDCLLNPALGTPLVKVYYEESDKEKVATRQNKGVTLVDKYRSFENDFVGQTQFSSSQYAFPENTAMNSETREYVGFSMTDLGQQYSTLENFLYQRGKIVDVVTGYEMSDAEAVELVYNLTYGVFLLHKHNIILGGLNPRNILYNTDKKLPMFLDIDSAQVDDYTCDVYTEEILDPLITRKRMDGSSDKEGAYEYSTESDIFTIAVIAYNLLVGMHPAFFPADKVGTKEKRPKERLFLLKVLLDTKLQTEIGLKFDAPPVKNAIERLRQLESNYPIIYQHFKDVFVEDQRDYITASLPESDSRHPDYWDYRGRTVDSVPLQFDLSSLPEQTLVQKDLPLERPGKFSLAPFLRAAQEIICLHYADTMRDSDAFKMLVSNLGYDYLKLIAGVKL